MLSHIYSCGLSGIDGFSVCVETDISNGLPAFDIVGLPDAAVKEAKERIRSAIKNTGFRFPAKHIVINLAPASKRKEGSGYDLPMALSIISVSYTHLDVYKRQKYKSVTFFQVNHFRHIKIQIINVTYR